MPACLGKMENLKKLESAQVLVKGVSARKVRVVTKTPNAHVIFQTTPESVMCNKYRMLWQQKLKKKKKN